MLEELLGQLDFVGILSGNTKAVAFLGMRIVELFRGWKGQPILSAEGLGDETPALQSFPGYVITFGADQGKYIKTGSENNCF